MGSDRGPHPLVLLASAFRRANETFGLVETREHSPGAVLRRTQQLVRRLFFYREAEAPVRLFVAVTRVVAGLGTVPARTPFA